MINVNNKYYSGFEGEPEIQIICKKRTGTFKWIIWEGYFDEIMKNVIPEENGWTGLSYYYNLCVGWDEEKPWKIDDLKLTLNQLSAVKCQSVSPNAREIIEMFCTIINEAINEKLDVFIFRE